MSFDPKHIVFDTSTLIACALTPSGTPRQALELAFQVHTVFTSEETLIELLSVLNRPKFDLWRPLEERLAFYAAFASSVRLIEPTAGVTGCRDPKDDKFLALAHACAPSLLVSSDQDLLVLGTFEGARIVNPKDFIGLRAEHGQP
jgi:uncharacterized protein